MFTLRQAHQDAFQAKAEENFVHKVMAYLREKHADTKVKLPTGEFTVAQLPEETLRRMIISGISKAQIYGMTWHSTIIAFVVIMFVAAPNFDEHPQIRDVWGVAKKFPNIFVDILWSNTNEDVWQDIVLEYEPKSWME